MGIRVAVTIPRQHPSRRFLSPGLFMAFAVLVLFSFQPPPDPWQAIPATGASHPELYATLAALKPPQCSPYAEDEIGCRFANPGGDPWISCVLPDGNWMLWADQGGRFTIEPLQDPSLIVTGAVACPGHYR